MDAFIDGRAFDHARLDAALEAGRAKGAGVPCTILPHDYFKPGSDRVTFNYGRALGSPKAVYDGAPWNRNDYQAEYEHAVKVTRALGDIAVKFSNAAWRMEMATRDVRLSETLKEQADMMADLRIAFHEIDRDLETVESDGMKWSRYGRIGNVLRRFKPW